MGELAPEEVHRIDQDRQTDLLLANGLGIDVPANMLPFGTVEEFRNHCNNFPRYFDIQNVGGLPVKLIRSRPVFKRFDVLFPFQSYYLQGRADAKAWLQDPQIWQELFDVYTIMSALVDAKDPYVMRDDVVDAYYLIR